jgi:4'-phosphopantetheinyl transferase
VDVWTIDLAHDDATVSAWTRELDEAERAQAARFRFDHHRRQFVVRRYARRAILADYLGAAPRELRFMQGGFGKPSLRDARLEYNATHSEDLALLAVSGERPVGIDVERVRGLGTDYEWLSATERERVRLLAPEDRTAAALRLWTRKEAWVKALGVGVGALDDGAGPAGPGEAARAPALTIVDCDPCPGYVASLAVPFPRPVRLHLHWTATHALAHASS